MPTSLTLRPIELNARGPAGNHFRRSALIRADPGLKLGLTLGPTLGLISASKMPRRDRGGLPFTQAPKRALAGARRRGARAAQGPIAARRRGERARSIRIAEAPGAPWPMRALRYPTRPPRLHTQARPQPRADRGPRG